MKTFEVSLSIDCRLTREIEAETEQEARNKAAQQIHDGEVTLEDHIREISIDDIEEITFSDED